MRLPPLAEIRKLAVYAVGAAAELVTLGFLHGQALAAVQAVIAAATAAGIYRVPNKPATK